MLDNYNVNFGLGAKYELSPLQYPSDAFILTTQDSTFLLSVHFNASLLTSLLAIRACMTFYLSLALSPSASV